MLVSFVHFVANLQYVSNLSQSALSFETCNYSTWLCGLHAKGKIAL